MNKQTAELLIGICAAGKHRSTCVINEDTVKATIADGVPLQVLGRKRVTIGEISSVECTVSCQGLDEQCATAKVKLADFLAAEQRAVLDAANTAVDQPPVSGRVAAPEE